MVDEFDGTTKDAVTMLKAFPPLMPGTLTTTFGWQLINQFGWRFIITGQL
jgi:hypothetical protein